jgi:DNA polymerase III epsilon subunit-like protein
MKILVFDTETTGLPDKGSPSFYDTWKWPYIIQFSYIVYDTDTNLVINISDNIIKIPDEVNVSVESENIHKISKEISINQGKNIVDVLNNFKLYVDECDLIIGHNINFDKNIVIVESIRNNMNRIFVDTKKFYCTMHNSKNICKIEKLDRFGNIYYKYPKLIELYKFYFNSEPDGLHNSMIDVLVTLRCFGMMMFNKDFEKCSQNLNAIFGLSTLFFS